VGKGDRYCCVSGTVCCCKLVVIVQVGSFQLECDYVEENSTVIVAY
jgi:hypothetical protein